MLYILNIFECASLLVIRSHKQFTRFYFEIGNVGLFSYKIEYSSYSVCTLEDVIDALYTFASDVRCLQVWICLTE
jgi:hypothetical protein